MTRGGWRWLGLLLVALSALLGTACTKCAGTRPLAELEQTQGQVDRDFSAKPRAWSPAAVGATFTVGDAVRTRSQAAATLVLDDASRVKLDESTVLRFLARRPGADEQRLEVETGQAVVEAAGDGLAIRTQFGLAQIEGGTKLRLRRSDQGLRLDVDVGLAVIETPQGKQELKPGQGIEVGIGEAVIERSPPAATRAPAPSASAALPEPSSGEITAEITGAGASVQAPGKTAFSALKPGMTQVAAGTNLRLSRGGSARVQRGNQIAQLQGAGQFVIGASDTVLVEARSGGVTLDGAPGTVVVSVPGGSIVAESGVRGKVDVGRELTKVNVASGRVTLESAEGRETLQGGEQGEIARGGGLDISGRSLEYADMVAGAGDSFTIHDPSPPTAVGFAFGGQCPSAGVIEIVRGGRTLAAVRGSGQANVALESGRNDYRLRCLGASGPEQEIKAKGTIIIMRDSGTARLPRSAPMTPVDTDGRYYRVLYQNLLPGISVRWPNAPQASSYTLTLESPGGRTSSVTPAQARHTFRAGTLAEGTHKLTFSAGGKSSKPTTLEIQFDNATPTASLKSPADRSFAPGAAVTVSGVALSGWTVSTGGKELPMDAQQRFNADVTAPAGQRALAIRFVHPGRGVHYYLRRVAGN
jgi:ferric-dicitrate binding protein FerR (iron transport regulator)